MESNKDIAELRTFMTWGPVSRSAPKKFFTFSKKIFWVLPRRLPPQVMKVRNSAKDIAIFAAGCFWGVQDYFDKVPGIIQTVVGYTGGDLTSPTYEQVSAGNTGHAEAVKVIFDSEHITYEQLVKHFFRLHDPTQINRQGSDIGSNYRSAIFYKNSHQKNVAREIIEQLTKENKFGKPIATELTKSGEFFPAEEYHQKFVQKNGYGACHIPYQPLA